MPKVHKVAKARKPHPECGVEVGESYYWWKIKTRYSGLWRCSKTYPRRSQLTLSDFLQQAYMIQEDIEASGPFEDATDLEAAREEWVGQIEELADEQEERRENMPEQLRESDSGYLLEERAEQCREWAEELERITIPSPDDFDLSATETDGEEDDSSEYLDALAAVLDEMKSTCPF